MVPRTKRTWTEDVREHVLTGIFVPTEEEGAGGWRRLHNEELRNLYASPNVITVIISRRMRWAGHVEYLRNA
jgi:hypothetical protein